METLVISTKRPDFVETEYIHDIIKQRLGNIKEDFSLPAYKEPTNSVLKQYIPKYSINGQEANAVLDKLDIPPSQITKEERVLRKKYLELIKKITIDDFEFMKANVATKLGATTMANMESVRNLTLYVIDLMLTDIDNIDNPRAANCPTCPSCTTTSTASNSTTSEASTSSFSNIFKDKKTLYIAGGVVGVLLLLLIILLLK
jgi:hypothetical protein